jgi:plasmid stabilization system protein ParE
MTLPLVLRPAARAEFADSATWYDQQQAGLGAEFVAEVEQVFDKIVEQPDRYPLALGDVREALVSRFPYCVYYRVRPSRIVVIAVFHAARDPAVWQSRI